jgi:hypothetical protein
MREVIDDTIGKVQCPLRDEAPAAGRRTPSEIILDPVDADRPRDCSDSQSGADRAAYYDVRVGSRHWKGFLSSSS